MTITNTKNVSNNLLVSYIEDAVVGKIYSDPFVIKNNTDSNVILTVLMFSQKDPVTTTFYPGWNVELCQSIISLNGASAGVGGIQIGQ